LRVSGEHIIAVAGPIVFKKDFFGADEALTNYVPGSTQWAATLIFTGKTFEEAWKKRCSAVEDIKKHFGLLAYDDPSPETMPQE
jgi:pyrrolysine biosynthesis protein PylC